MGRVGSRRDQAQHMRQRRSAARAAASPNGHLWRRPSRRSTDPVTSTRPPMVAAWIIMGTRGRQQRRRVCNGEEPRRIHIGASPARRFNTDECSTSHIPLSPSRPPQLLPLSNTAREPYWGPCCYWYWLCGGA
ncbi:unnamed protein product [Urochloa humidicola]